MINAKRMCCIMVALAAGLPLSAAVAQPKAADTCAECHGEKGISTEDTIPTIAGASSFFLENQLVIYQKEARPCAQEEFSESEPKEVQATDHCALARNLSEAEVGELANYFSGLAFQPADQPVDQALAKQGASLHQKHCDKCHTQGGSLAMDDAGILAGQWKPYLMEQLQHFKDGRRWQPEKMKPAIEQLSEQDMKALVEYYASQGAKRF